MLGGADNPNGELPSYITGADTGGSAFTRPCGAWPCGFSVMWPPCRVRAVPCLHRSRASAGGMQGKVNRCGHPVPPSRLP